MDCYSEWFAECGLLSPGYELVRCLLAILTLCVAVPPITGYSRQGVDRNAQATATHRIIKSAPTSSLAVLPPVTDLRRQSEQVDDTPSAGFFLQEQALQMTQAVSEPMALLVFGLAMLVIGSGLRRRGLEGKPQSMKTSELKVRERSYPAVQLAEVTSLSPSIRR